jgi:hypothetical protein
MRSSEREGAFAKGVMYLAIAVVSLGIFFAGNCGAPDPKLGRSLEKQGFTKVTVGEWDAFECGTSDSISRTFTATNGNGQQVRGTICCGFFFKGCTVRW